MMRTFTSFLALAALAGAGVAQDFTVPVPNNLKSKIGKILPERSNAAVAYVSEVYDTNLVFTQPSTVRIIFVREKTGYRNTLGYFTYTDNTNGTVTVNSADLLIPEASYPNQVQEGDGFDLRDAGGSIRTFNPGEKVGFFVIADGARSASSLVSGWTYNYTDGLGQVPDSDPEVNEQRGRGLYTTVSALNPEMATGARDRSRHMIMVQMPGLAGFLGGDPYLLCAWEDLRRTGNSGDAFNKLIFALEVNTPNAIGGTSVFSYDPNDPDGDGVSGLNDAFPNDGDRASVERIPSYGLTMIAFEDRYPERGDADFNDAAVAYAFEIAKDGDGNVKDIVLTVSLVARGAWYESAFGVHFPGLPQTATGTIKMERFASGATTGTMAPQRTVQGLIAAGTRRIEDMIDSAKTMLPPPNGFQYSNTQFASGIQDAASARIHIEFDVAIPESLLGTPPYDPFLYVDNPRFPNIKVDIHLPGKPSFADRPSYLPVESGPNTFIDGAGFPWALEVPNGWRFPMEATDIDDAYSLYEGYRTSGGTMNQDWYLGANSSAGFVGPTLESLVPVRTWAIGIPR